MSTTPTPRRQEFVTFLSPGTFVSESTTKPIASRDTRLAVEMAEQVTERHGAKPYGFRFETRIVVDPVSDGEGGTIAVPGKTVDKSGTYFLGARLETYDDVVGRASLQEVILRDNMRFNGWWIVATTTNGYRSTMPFEEADRVVDANGKVIESGVDPKHVAYRAGCAERFS